MKKKKKREKGKQEKIRTPSSLWRSARFSLLCLTVLLILSGGLVQVHLSKYHDGNLYNNISVSPLPILTVSPAPNSLYGSPFVWYGAERT